MAKSVKYAPDLYKHINLHVLIIEPGNIHRQLLMESAHHSSTISSHFLFNWECCKVIERQIQVLSSFLWIMSESFWSVLGKISVLKSKGWALYVLWWDHPNSWTIKLSLVYWLTQCFSRHSIQKDFCTTDKRTMQHDCNHLGCIGSISLCILSPSQPTLPFLYIYILWPINLPCII